MKKLTALLFLIMGIGILPATAQLTSDESISNEDNTLTIPIPQGWTAEQRAGGIALYSSEISEDFIFSLPGTQFADNSGAVAIQMYYEETASNMNSFEANVAPEVNVFNGLGTFDADDFTSPETFEINGAASARITTTEDNFSYARYIVNVSDTHIISANVYTSVDFMESVHPVITLILQDAETPSSNLPIVPIVIAVVVIIALIGGFLVFRSRQST